MQSGHVMSFNVASLTQLWQSTVTLNPKFGEGLALRAWASGLGAYGAKGLEGLLV